MRLDLKTRVIAAICVGFAWAQLAHAGPAPASIAVRLSAPGAGAFVSP